MQCMRAMQYEKRSKLEVRQVPALVCLSKLKSDPVRGTCERAILEHSSDHTVLRPQMDVRSCPGIVSRNPGSTAGGYRRIRHHSLPAGSGPAAAESACSISLNSMGDHHGTRRQYHSPRAVEQGQARRAKGALQSERRLGPARPPADGRAGARSRALQLGYRQQASRMRSRRPQGSRRLSSRPSRYARHCDATQDPASRSVRDNGSGQRRSAGVDQACEAEVGRLPIPQSAP